jgi:hypothetical protein
MISSIILQLGGKRLTGDGAAERIERQLGYSHFPVPWHFRRDDEQFPGSASLPSGPMQVCV